METTLEQSGLNQQAKLACLYCGNNPTPHLMNWYFETVNVLFTPLRNVLLYNPVTNGLRKIGYAMNMPYHTVRFFSLLGIITFQKNITVCKVRRAQVLWEEADKRGFIFSELLLFSRPFDTYMAQRTKNSTLKTKTNPELETLVFSGLPRPQSSNPEILDVMDDKAYFKKQLLGKNIPVPQGGSAATLSKALKIFSAIQKPVIVKPRTGSRGRHSITFIYTKEQLREAFKIAKQLCFWVMVEEQLFGPVYRATVIDYQLCGVLRGDSPEITGDGKKTIQQLVEEKNNIPREGVKNILLDERTDIFLKRQNLTTTSILNNGQTISLTEKIGISYGGSSSEDIDICHPDNKELFVRAARVMGDPIVGFDYIIQDITKSYKEQRTGFLEANSLPFINLHHDPLLGPSQNVAKHVWDMMGW